MQDPAGSKRNRLLIVSNRLPVKVTRNADGNYSYALSSGGLVSAISGLKKDARYCHSHTYIHPSLKILTHPSNMIYSFTWIGWPGLELQANEQQRVHNDLLTLHSCVPVFLKDSVADAHYNGFSNSILWPLFHYHPGEISFSESDWVAYQEANEAFADALVAQIEDGDLVWVHDYHLMLLPLKLREKLEGSGKEIKVPTRVHDDDDVWIYYYSSVCFIG